MGIFSTSPGARLKRLQKAMARGSNEKLRKLIEEGVEVNPPSGGYNPLLDAIRRGRSSVVQQLLLLGADPNAQDSTGNTPLGLAASQWSSGTSIAEMLFAQGADLQAAGESGETPFFKAVYRNNLPLAQLFLEKGADVNVFGPDRQTPLHYAAQRGEGAQLRLLLDHGASVNAQDQKGITPLHLAAKKGLVENVKLLLERGADPALTDLYMNTPAHFAEEEYPGIAKLLHEAVPAPPAAQQIPGGETWKLLGDDEIARVTVKEAIGYRLTETFNFHTRLYTHLARSLETGAESQSVKAFAEMDGSPLLGDALAEFEACGGRPPRSVFDKSKPALFQPRPEK